jgi:hypothetical protein
LGGAGYATATVIELELELELEEGQLEPQAATDVTRATAAARAPMRLPSMRRSFICIFL